jgi:RNA polymerase sigma factor (sigma-70 family)
VTVPAIALPPFQSLLDAHADGVRRFLRSRLPAADADDAFQETFLAALRAYPALRNAENLEGWIFTVAHRKSLDVHRRRPREQPLETAAEPSAEDPPVFDAALWRRVDALPPRQRTAVALRFACDLSYAEIAAHAGGSAEAARRNVFVALTTLRREIDTP